MRPIFISATGQHVGKTTIALGLLSALKKRGLRCQYFKPVGQHFEVRNGQRADDDVWLCRELVESKAEAEIMSPLIVLPGYVEQYLEHPEPERLRQRITDAARMLSQEADLLVVEGTGHAGVGSCLGLSNATVARLLGAVALIVVPGGIGRSLDEVQLNLTLFQTTGVPVCGVICNKVFSEKIDKVARALKQGLRAADSQLLGTIPYEAELASPTLRQVCEELQARVLCGEGSLDRRVSHNLVASMTPQNVMSRLKPQSLLIMPGDRVDNILLAITMEATQQATAGIAGIVLTGGFLPPLTVMPLLKRSGLPVLLCQEDTYEVTTRISRRVYKISSADSRKIEAAQRLVQEHVDIEAILASAAGEPQKLRQL